MAETQINSKLRAAHSADVRCRAIRAAMIGVATVLLIVLLFVLVDGLLGLSVPLRWFGLIVLFLALLDAAWTVVSIMRRRFDPSRAARLLERSHGIEDSRLINAVQLSPDAGLLRARSAGGAGLAVPGGALVMMAVDRAAHHAEKIEPRRVFDRAALVRPVRVLIGFVLVAALGSAIVPRVFGAAVPRLLLPSADLPPYTAVRFDISIKPSEIVPRNKTIEIIALLSGSVAIDTATLVMWPINSATDNDAPQQLTMHRSGDDRFSLRLTAAPQTSRFYVSTAHGRSKTYLLRSSEVPQFESATLTVTPPLYTMRPTQTLTLSSTDIKVFVGSAVRIDLTSNVPLDHAMIELTDEDGTEHFIRFEGAADDSNDSGSSGDAPHAAGVSGEWVAERSSRYSITLIGRDSLESDRKLVGRISAIPDAPPTVDIDAPAPVLEAPVGWSLPLPISVTDDVAVTRVALLIQQNDSALQTLEVPIDSAGQNRVAAEHLLDLDAIGAKAGDVLHISAAAWDNKPDDAQRGVSESVTVRVISPEEYDRRAQQVAVIDRLYEEIARLRSRTAELDQLREGLSQNAERLAEQAGRTGEPDEAQRSAAELKESIESYTDETEQLAGEYRQIAEAYKSASGAQQALQSMTSTAAQLSEHTEQLRQIIDSLSQPSTESLADAAQSLSETSAGQMIPNNTSRNTADASDAAGTSAANDASPGQSAMLVGPLSPSGRTLQSGEGSAASPSSNPRLADGVSTETITINAEGRKPRSAPADDYKVPSRYRELTADYLRRIAEDSR